MELCPRSTHSIHRPHTSVKRFFPNLLPIVGLIVVALLSPRAAGRLPTLKEVERPPATICNVPLIGPIFGQVQRLVTRATWQLETIPIE